MKITRGNGTVVFESNHDTIRATLKAAAEAKADLTGADLRGADLRGADLRGADLRGAVLTDADLRGADLTGADLTDAVLTDAVLTDAVLTDAVLTDAVLPTRVIVPNLDQRMLEVCSAPGALNMERWHSCETTHCRAGWAIQLAGAAGKVLEDLFGPPAAGALIYAASVPGRKIPNFYANDEEAMTDITACAAEAAGSAPAPA